MSDYKNVFESVQSLSPRMRQAIRLYQSAAVPTKRAASTAVGFHPNYLTVMSNYNAMVREAMAAEQTRVQIDMGKLLHELSLQALDKIREKMHNGGSEAVQLKAAIDLADRGPQTSKIQKHQVESWSLNSVDAKEIAAAMVEGARIRQEFASLGDGNHDRTGVSTPPESTDV